PAPRWGAPVNGAGVVSEILNGAGGWRKRPDGDRTKVPRAWNWSNVVTVEPLPTGPLGMRSSSAAASTSAVVRTLVRARHLVDLAAPLEPTRVGEPVLGVVGLELVGTFDEHEEVGQLLRAVRGE